VFSWFYLIAQYFVPADTLQTALLVTLALTINTTGVRARRLDQVVSSDPKAHFAGLNKIQVSIHGQRVD
jgi:hypothetical protein